MTLARLFAVAILLSSAVAFAQDQLQAKQGPLNFGSLDRPVLAQDAQATPSEPWRIVPSTDHVQAGDNGTGLLHLDDESPKPTQLQSANTTQLPAFDFARDGQLPVDVTCFTIRSYVMARDQKGSDATHLVHYSTCQPTNRYRLRTAQIQEVPAER